MMPKFDVSEGVEDQTNVHCLAAAARTLAAGRSYSCAVASLNEHEVGKLSAETYQCLAFYNNTMLAIGSARIGMTCKQAEVKARKH